MSDLLQPSWFRASIMYRLRNSMNTVVEIHGKAGEIH